jgi:hypothetical protein
VEKEFIAFTKTNLLRTATLGFGACHFLRPTMDCGMALFGSIATVRAQSNPAEIFAASFACLDDLFRPGLSASLRFRGISTGETQRIELAGGARGGVYPSDIHMPGLWGDAGPALVRKTVIKVPVGAR